jgi:hypothetical protein
MRAFLCSNGAWNLARGFRIFFEGILPLYESRRCETGAGMMGGSRWVPLAVRVDAWTIRHVSTKSFPLIQQLKRRLMLWRILKTACALLIST